MSKRKRKKKSGNQKDSLASTFNLIAAILNLVIAILLAIEKLIKWEESLPSPKMVTRKTRNVKCP